MPKEEKKQTASAQSSPMETVKRTTIADVYQAAKQLEGVARHTELIHSDYFSEISRNDVYLKPENLQHTGAFKLRGAYNKISQLTEAEKQRGVITASAGNHAQGVALAATQMGIRSIVCMPDGAPISKVEATKSLGAEVRLVPGTYDDAHDYAVKLQQETGATFIHPFDDLAVATGQGTVAMEIFKELPLALACTVEDLIEEEECVYTMSHNGYIKRQPMDEYRTQRRGGRGVSGIARKEEDFVEEMFICGSHDNILFISNKGIMYKLKCYEIPDGSKASRGFNLINLLPLTENEKIAAMIKTTDFSDEKFITMVTKNGKIKRTNLSLYKNVRKNGLIAIGLDEGDEIAGVRMTDGNAQLFVATHNGMAIRLEESKGRALSRSAHGVRAIKLRDGDYVVSMARESARVQLS